MTEESEMKYLGLASLKIEGESCLFDPDCPPRVKKIKSRKKLRRRIAELEAALKPFVWENSATFDALFGNYTDGTVSQFTVKIGDLRAARAAYRGEKE